KSAIRELAALCVPPQVGAPPDPRMSHSFGASGVPPSPAPPSRASAMPPVPAEPGVPPTPPAPPGRSAEPPVTQGSYAPIVAGASPRLRSSSETRNEQEDVAKRSERAHTRCKGGLEQCIQSPGGCRLKNCIATRCEN